MDLLFHRDVVVANLASGSRGNCTYVGSPTQGVLIDCGLSTKQVLQRLDQIGLGKVRINGVMITHEHTDHVASARILSDRLRKRQGKPVPFHMTRGTASNLNPRCAPADVVPIAAGISFTLGALKIDPFRLPHDVADPVGYLISLHDVNVGVITDLGRTTRLVEQQLSRCDVAVLEFNHDEQMLMDGPYPWALKQRVRSAHGHLSNDESEALVAASATPRLKHLILAHLSEENNRPELALAAAARGLHRAGLRRVEVCVASQRQPMGPVEVRAPTEPSKPPRRARPPARPHTQPPAPRPREAQLPLFSRYS
ncbi:MAG TPA: MBL fold metallo-hydrolase [Deltaproteobacteria bacterium]|nr:MBL fold metallo-hydrolase [Deltaproteobacteria bacterium]